MLLDGKTSLNNRLWNTMYCSVFSEHRLVKAKHGSEQVKKKTGGASTLWRTALTVMDRS